MVSWLRICFVGDWNLLYRRSVILWVLNDEEIKSYS
jgi:hypothetical protein